MLGAMGLFDRMGRVVSSNFNALLDQIEDPSKSVNDLVEGMREQLRAGRRQVVESVAADKQLARRVETLDAQVERWRQRAELAVRAGDDGLARGALLKKRQLVAERDRAEALRAEQRACASQMKAEVDRMGQRLSEVEARKSTIAVQLGHARAGGGAEALGRKSSGVTPFDELRRFEGQIEGVEWALEAQREVDAELGRGAQELSETELEGKFLELERRGTPPDGETAALDDELLALKRRVRVE